MAIVVADQEFADGGDQEAGALVIAATVSAPVASA